MCRSGISQARSCGWRWWAASWVEVTLRICSPGPAEAYEPLRSTRCPVHAPSRHLATLESTHKPPVCNCGIPRLLSELRCIYWRGQKDGAERRVMRARTATTYGLDLRTHRQNLVRCLRCAGTRRGPRSLRKPRAKASKMDVVGVSSGHEVQACAARQPHHSRHGVREPAAPPHPAASWPPSCPPDRPPTCPQHTGNEQIGTQWEQG